MKNNWQTKKIGQAILEDKESKIQQWQTEINEILKDVEDLLYSNYQAEELEKIIKSNIFVQRNIGTFWEHYKLNLTYFLVSKIWHQIDEDSDSLSLINLLNDLKYNYSLVTKGWWLAQSNLLTAETFEEKFGNISLDPNIVDQDIQDLKQATNEIKNMRHKRIAHTDKNRELYSEISHTKIINAIDQIEKLVIKYFLLLTQSGRNGLTPIPDDWLLAFTKEWISNEK